MICGTNRRPSELFFEEHPELDDAAKEVLAGETVPTVLTAFKENYRRCQLRLGSQSSHQRDPKETGIKGKNLFMPIRWLQVKTHGPELPDTR